MINPVAKAILAGVHDEHSPLSKLCGVPHILQIIWIDVTSYWKKFMFPPEHKKHAEKRRSAVKLPTVDVNIPFRKLVYGFNFPTPQGIKINMMPFRMSDKFEICRLPKELAGYHAKILKLCLHDSPSLMGKVCFLTIQEGFVSESKLNLKSGLHVERPGKIWIPEEVEDEETKEKTIDASNGGGKAQVLSTQLRSGGHFFSSEYYHEGTYMTFSTVNSGRIWNCTIKDNGTTNRVIGKQGDVEHLRHLMTGSAASIEENTLYWLTDSTPHEFIPLEQGSYQQFFKLVTSEVSVWYRNSSTENPMGILPDPEVTRII